MITTKEVKIPIPKDCSSEQIEEALKKMGYDVLRWAITKADNEYYILDIAIIE